MKEDAKNEVLKYLQLSEFYQIAQKKIRGQSLKRPFPDSSRTVTNL